MEKIESSYSTINSQLSVGRSPDRNEALLDLSKIHDDLALLEKAIADGSTTEIDAAKANISSDIADLQSVLTNYNDFSPLERKMVNGAIAQAQDITMIPDELLTSSKDEYLVACGTVQGVINFTIAYIEEDGEILSKVVFRPSSPPQ